MWNLCGVVVFHGSMVSWRRGWGQSVMKLIWCSCLTWIYAQLEEGCVSLSWKLFSVMVLQRSMLDWWEVQQPEVFSVMVFHGSMVNWRREGWGHVYHVVVLVVHLPLFIHNYRWTRTLYNNNSNIQIHLHKLLHIFLIIHLLMMITPM